MPSVPRTAPPPTPRPYRQFRGAHEGAPVFSHHHHAAAATLAAAAVLSLELWTGTVASPNLRGPPCMIGCLPACLAGSSSPFSGSKFPCHARCAGARSLIDRAPPPAARRFGYSKYVDLPPLRADTDITTHLLISHLP